ncbi:MAG: hypothetical protein GY789_03645 [Hyphomicrobiales bacterium]|nr:hypothetical protein [Hyphomicrobiales bacterium]MCP4997238.1 hypothetical protein [Hyphomicrobiales bacterium]
MGVRRDDQGRCRGKAEGDDCRNVGTGRGFGAGTLGYQWSISDDGSHGQVHERYRDSEAALAHLASFNKNFAARLMELVNPAGMVVFGTPSAALKKELEGAGPVNMLPAGGFVR